MSAVYWFTPTRLYQNEGQDWLESSVLISLPSAKQSSKINLSIKCFRELLETSGQAESSLDLARRVARANTHPSLHGISHLFRTNHYSINGSANDLEEAEMFLNGVVNRNEIEESKEYKNFKMYTLQRLTEFKSVEHAWTESDELLKTFYDTLVQNKHFNTAKLEWMLGEVKPTAFITVAIADRSEFPFEAREDAFYLNIGFDGVVKKCVFAFSNDLFTFVD